MLNRLPQARFDQRQFVEAQMANQIGSLMISKKALSVRQPWAYPYDRNQQLAKDVFMELRKKNAIPMVKWIAISEDTGVGQLIQGQVSSDRAFPAVVNAIGHKDSQFSRDTFWRVVSVTDTTKSLMPFASLPSRSVRLEQETINNRVSTYLRCVDQSILEFELQFHRPRETETIDYRIREIHIASSPTVLAGTFQDKISTRSYGRSVVALPVPATSSLSDSRARYLFETAHHEDDEKKDFPYGPELPFTIKYRKWGWRVFLALAALSGATALLAWAAFVVSVPTGTFTNVSPIWERVVASVCAVLLTLYAYYLWSDDVSLDKARR